MCSSVVSLKGKGSLEELWAQVGSKILCFALAALPCHPLGCSGSWGIAGLCHLVMGEKLMFFYSYTNPKHVLRTVLALLLSDPSPPEPQCCVWAVGTGRGLLLLCLALSLGAHFYQESTCNISSSAEPQRPGAAVPIRARPVAARTAMNKTLMNKQSTTNTFYEVKWQR